MGLESSFNFIDDLDSSNPAASDDPSVGDDHIRGTKSAVKGSFTSLGSAAVTKTAAEINDLATLTGAETLSGPKTLEDPVILDANSNESITFVSTASAVNNVRMTNAATGNAAKIDVTETNTDLELAGNGTGGVYGTLKLDTVQTPSGVTDVDFTVPAWAKKITVNIHEVSVAASWGLSLKVGTGGTPANSGYVCGRAYLTTGVVSGITSGFSLLINGTSGSEVSGQAVLTLLDSANDIWTMQSTAYEKVLDKMQLATGTVDLSGTMNILRVLTTANMTQGSINVVYEG